LGTIIRLRYLIAFTSAAGDTIKPFPARKGNSIEEVEVMSQAWCKALSLYVTVQSRAYAAESDW